MAAATSAAEVARMVQPGSMDPAIPTQQSLNRIRAADPQLRAFATVRQEAALAEAEALRARPDLATLPLAGVPVAVKDSLAVTGLQTRAGSLAGPEATATHDDIVVQRLRAAGAVVLGTTAMCEGALWATTDSPGAVTRNPREAGTTSGGSSGGAAVAVAAGMVQLAHGTDAMGSVRIPAACCGVVGFKPGRNVVRASRDDASDWYGYLVDGLLGRSVGDVALGAQVLAETPLQGASDAGALRVRVLLDSPFRRLPPAQNAARRGMAEALRQLGHQVSEYPLRTVASRRSPSFLATDALLTWARAAADTRDAADHPARLQRRTVGLARVADLTRPLHATVRRRRDAVGDIMERMFGGSDVLVTAVTAGAAPPAREWSTASTAHNCWDSLRFSAGLCPPWNALGCPALVLPVPGQPASPGGVQLIARPGHDGSLLGLGRRLEESGASGTA